MKNEIIIIKKLEHINRILHAESRDELTKLCPYAKSTLEDPEASIFAIMAGCASGELESLLKEIENNA
ncbi:hypothetical protein [Thomasclavelia cocleata]|uniref:hypothetical protein n=1 Tax=Thomasclavelia cocleata TaxID=69824 RepID=UPI00272AC9E5|nr:hypothetical protein [Thomasclavelia cocleata]